MKKKSRITIIAIAALITFGSLFALKGGMYRHHWQHHSEHCNKIDSEDNKSNFQFNKTDENEMDHTDK